MAWDDTLPDVGYSHGGIGARPLNSLMLGIYQGNFLRVVRRLPAVGVFHIRQSAFHHAVYGTQPDKLVFSF